MRGEIKRVDFGVRLRKPSKTVMNPADLYWGATEIVSARKCRAICQMLSVNVRVYGGVCCESYSLNQESCTYLEDWSPDEKLETIKQLSLWLPLQVARNGVQKLM